MFIFFNKSNRHMFPRVILIEKAKSKKVKPVKSVGVVSKVAFISFFYYVPSGIFLLKSPLGNFCFKFTKKYFILFFQSIIQSKNSFVFSFFDLSPIFLQKPLINVLQKYLQNIFYGYVVEMSLIGTGFFFERIRETQNCQYIKVGLGFSHYFFLVIPLSVYLVIDKNSILLVSVNIMQLSAFVCKLRALMKKDVYKGKGFNFIKSFSKFSIKKLKVGKKR